jgi:twitching motility protein PilT
MDHAAAEAPRASDLEARLFGHPGAASHATPAIITAMLDSGKGISDLIFSPGRPLQVEQHGELVPARVDGLDLLTPEDTARIARDLIGGSFQVLSILDKEGATDFSYSLPSRARFRVNVYRQRGT